MLYLSSQVVEIKLHLEILCKRQKALRLQKSGNKGESALCSRRVGFLVYLFMFLTLGIDRVDPGQSSKPAPASGEKDSRVVRMCICLLL